MFIIGHQWPSVAISWQSPVMGCPLSLHSDAIRMHPDAIRGNQLAITCDGVPVELDRGRVSSFQHELRARAELVRTCGEMGAVVRACMLEGEFRARADLVRTDDFGLAHDRR